MSPQVDTTASLTDLIAEPAMAIDGHRSVTHVNDAFVATFRVPRDRVIGAVIGDEVHAESIRRLVVGLVSPPTDDPPPEPDPRTSAWSLEIVPLGSSGGSIAVIRIRGVDSIPPRSPRSPAFSARSYGVVRTGNRALVLDETETLAGQACHAVHANRAEPCSNCPVFEALELEHDVESAWVGDDDSMHLIRAQRTGEATAICERIALPLESTESVLRARIEHRMALARLSPREREVLTYLRLGRTVEEIAIVMNLSYHTIKFHIANLLEKLGADSRVDLLRILT